MASRGLSQQQVMQVVNRYIGVDGGYLGDFSYRSHGEFYIEWCNLPDIDPSAPEYFGTTRQRFVQILSSRPPLEQAAILRGVVGRFGGAAYGANPERAQLGERMLGWAAELEAMSPVPLDAPEATLDVVRRALEDADTLLRSSGPVSVVDRVHTALHGHLKALCAAAGISIETDANLPRVFRRLRDAHPTFAVRGPRADDVGKILQGLAQTLGALNALRNQASVAHPNEELLGKAEAMLAVNATRTVLAYLEAKQSTDA